MLTTTSQCAEGEVILHVIGVAQAAAVTSAPQLTGRQREILALLAEGKQTKEIARGLNLSNHTVRHHVEAIRRKLDAPTRLAAVARARQLHLV